MPEPLVEWREVEGELKPFVKGEEVAWAPQEGSQRAFLECPIEEVLYTGTRGPGKSDALIMDFAQHTGQGFGIEWRGLLFRQTYPQLKDIIDKSKKWFPLLFPRAKYNEGAHTWTWPDGENLRFTYGHRPEDYWNYHGHCVDEGEVLTEDGWRPIQDVVVGTRVLSVDEQDRLSWQVVASITREHYVGDLVRHVGRGRYMSFTPNHRLPTLDGLREYCQTGSELRVRVAGWQWAGQHLPVFGVPFIARTVRDHCVETMPLTISGDDFCELMGWWLSEGNVSSTAVCIAQEKSEGRSKISALLDRIGVTYRVTAGGFSFLSKSWSVWLSQFGKSRDKFVPIDIKNSDRTQLQKFFDAYVDGDGSRQGRRCYIYTISRRMADDLAEIAVRLGYSAYVTSRQRTDRVGPGYCVACNPKPVLRLRTDNRQRRLKRLSYKTQVRRVHHDGLVYCLGVTNNHTFFVRQRGSVWLSGNSWPWIAWEELTTWPDPALYLRMMSCWRSTHPKVPRKYRSTTNPYGTGHGWVKRRFGLPVPPNRSIGRLIEATSESGEKVYRIAIHGKLSENRILLTADPMYIERIRMAARNPSELAAWLEGSWDIIAGGMFDDVWNANDNVVPNFEVPNSWRIDRSFDWGSSKPFSVGWWAESDGSDLLLPDGRWRSTVRGDLFRIAEWYGWNNEPNEGLRMTATDIARGMIEREIKMKIHSRCKPGPADTAIFKTENGMSVAKDLMQSLLVDGQHRRVLFVSSNSAPGTRKAGWQIMRQRMQNAHPTGHGPREFPGFFVCERCDQFRRTVPVLPRDDSDLDDVNTDAEDHIGDDCRYRILFSKWRPKSGRVVGLG